MEQITLISVIEFLNFINFDKLAFKKIHLLIKELKRVIINHNLN